MRTRTNASREMLLRFLAVGAISAAAYHAFVALGVVPDAGSSITRHATFVVIDAVTAWYVFRRPLWLLPAFVMLWVQQTFSHGGRALRWWSESHSVDVISIVVVVGMWCGLGLLLLDARDRSTLVRRFVCPFGAA
jgi:hypothetical protein